MFFCMFRRLLAPTEVISPRTECIYGWTSAFRAEADLENCTLNITLRIRLVADDGVSAADLAACRARWEPAIEAAWSGQFLLMQTDGTCACEQYTVVVDVQFVDNNAHHTVTVHAGSGRADMTNWYVNSTGGTASHEAGHMFGNVDEYVDANCPGRTVTNDGSIMQSSQNGSVLARHYESFAQWISNSICCTYEAQ